MGRITRSRSIAALPGFLGKSCGSQARKCRPKLVRAAGMIAVDDVGAHAGRVGCSAGFETTDRSTMRMKVLLRVRAKLVRNLIR